MNTQKQVKQAEKPPLVLNANIASVSMDIELVCNQMGEVVKESPELKIANKRIELYRLQSLARELLPESRCAKCMRVMVKPEVTLVHFPKLKRGAFHGLATCASVWVCPICAAKITERRRQELESANMAKYQVVFVTFTLQHSREDKLVSLLDSLKQAYRGLKGGRRWQGFKERRGYVGSVTATELTWGVEYGWHVHLHVLMLFSRKGQDVDEIRQELSSRYAEEVSKLGGYVSPIYGVHVRLADDVAKDYLTKLEAGRSWGISHELTKASVKLTRGGIESGKHYTPFGLLVAYGEGSTWAGGVFQEYAKAMHGRHHLEYSRGTREALGLGQAQPTDQDLAEAPEDEVGVILASLNKAEWKTILKRELRGILQVIVASGNRDTLKAFLARHGVFIREVEKIPPVSP